jgi:hypothetical protein
MPVSGPFFSPNIDSVVDAYVAKIERKVSDETRRRLTDLMRKVFKHPRPWYWLHVLSKPRADYHVVTDGGIVYGPWLEGTGSRNRTTRFKGYRSFRLTTQQMNRPSVQAYIVDPVITDLMKVMNR